MEVIDNAAKVKNDREPAYRPAVFGPGEVVQSGIAEFLDAASCREWVLSKLHPDGPQCPVCAEPIVNRFALQSYSRGDRVKCRRCGKFFTALTGTFLSGIHFSFAQVILMAILIDSGADDTNIARLMNISSEGVRGWRSRFATTSGMGIRESRDGEKGGVVVAEGVSL